MEAAHQLSEVRNVNVLAITGAVVAAVLKIALLVGVGVKLELQGVLDGSKRKCMSALAMDVCLPCLLFVNVLPNASPHLIYEGWPLLLWPFVYAPIGALVGAACCSLVGIPFRFIGSAAACAAFPNVNGFPVAIISALGDTIPYSATGISPMTFLSLVQLTDGVIKYTLGPAVFRRDLNAQRKYRSCLPKEHLPLGHSLRSVLSVEEEPSCQHVPGGLDGGAGAAPQRVAEEAPKANGSRVSQNLSHVGDACAEDSDDSEGTGLQEFGLKLDQVRAVEPEFCRQHAYILWTRASQHLDEKDMEVPNLQRRLLEDAHKEKDGQNHHRSHHTWSDFTDLFRQLFPPQVLAVIVALSIGVGPSWLKALLVAPTAEELGEDVAPPLFGFVVGCARELGGGFVPLQMISLGGRLVNVASSSGPLAAGGSAGPRGRSRLLRIAGAVGVARMLLAPTLLFLVAFFGEKLHPILKGRPLAFWVPPLVVAAMPTANNMSTMADLVGSGRSISAATTAMQLLMSPLVLAVTLTLLIAGAQSSLCA
eukprot:TRINITY_DN91220_c0_g1_i1.p1 TRINITY_DN91220_c0_g1~~TRINITY_DN91220_c0_g1_i1.p1  ORF type:complete len:535 (+),score=115.83 TRINITY_DN91220_c0_g1_i1:75-1679(+)